jgi:acyl-CoA reductase-like NAD-dependent aldehyde dehydrogenase
LSNASSGDNAKFASSVLSASPEDVSRAISQAQGAFQSGVWSKSSAAHRSNVLSRLARALENRVPDLAKLETLQTGRAIREMNAQLNRLPEWLWVMPYQTPIR